MWHHTRHSDDPLLWDHCQGRYCWWHHPDKSIKISFFIQVSCHLLLKSALLARRRNFENLAFHTFGNSGKLFIELGITGYLVGTTIAFFVVMGDLGPPIIAGFAEVENTANLRLVILTCLGLFVALPLSLVRNISSLQHICAASISFYCCVVLRVVLEAVPNISSGQTETIEMLNYKM